MFPSSTIYLKIMSKFFLPLFLFSSFLFAGSNTKSDNNLYAALKWEIGGNPTPEFVLGLRKAEIDSSGDVRGNDISLTFNLIGEKQFNQTRLKSFNGHEAVQTEISLGYDLAGGLFFGPGVNAPHVNLGLDFYPVKKQVKNYLYLHTIQKYHKTDSPSQNVEVQQQQQRIFCNVQCEVQQP